MRIIFVLIINWNKCRPIFVEVYDQSKMAPTCDFQCDILTCVDLDEPVQPLGCSLHLSLETRNDVQSVD